MSLQKNKPQAGPVEPSTKEPYKSKINPNDLTIGEQRIYEGTVALVGALNRVSKEKKYSDKLIERLEKEDTGNPVTAYVKTIAFYASELKKAIDNDPEFQAALEMSERRMFMRQMEQMG